MQRTHSLGRTNDQLTFYYCRIDRSIEKRERGKWENLSFNKQFPLGFAAVVIASSISHRVSRRNEIEENQATAKRFTAYTKRTDETSTIIRWYWNRSVATTKSYLSGDHQVFRVCDVSCVCVCVWALMPVRDEVKLQFACFGSSRTTENVQLKSKTYNFITLIILLYHFIS